MKAGSFRIGVGVLAMVAAVGIGASVQANPPPSGGPGGGVPSPNNPPPGVGGGGIGGGVPTATGGGTMLPPVHLPTWDSWAADRKITWLKQAYDAEHAQVGALEKRVAELEKLVANHGWLLQQMQSALPIGLQNKQGGPPGGAVGGPVPPPHGH